MESKGYAARREPSEHAGGKWIYRYASALGGAGTIEIDINYLSSIESLSRRLCMSVHLENQMFVSLAAHF